MKNCSSKQKKLMKNESKFFKIVFIFLILSFVHNLSKASNIKGEIKWSDIGLNWGYSQVC